MHTGSSLRAPPYRKPPTLLFTMRACRALMVFYDGPPRAPSYPYFPPSFSIYYLYENEKVTSRVCPGWPLVLVNQYYSRRDCLTLASSLPWRKPSLLCPLDREGLHHLK
jgi:hypothetical protein